MINPIKAIDQKIFNDQETIRLTPSSFSPSVENGVDKSSHPNTFVDRKDSVELRYDIDRYVRILKNMIVPPEDRFDASILLELELGGEITANDVKRLISEVQRKETSKVKLKETDADSGGKEA
jgi:hypothetical protein